jgi:hypothetical protein
MRFQLRIIAVTLAILITALVLNSVLSLAAFEKLYLGSLVSTIELAGKNLKRKIEQALRFGKPFESFKGLDSLLAEVLRDNPEISSVGVSNLQGKILYHTDEHMIGEELALPLPVFQRQDSARSQLLGETYITFLPLFDRSEALAGVIHLSFPRSVITKRLQFMATENAKVLALVVAFTSVGLIIGMTFWLTRPLRGRILAIGNRLIAAKGPQGLDRPPGDKDDVLGRDGKVPEDSLEPEPPIELPLPQKDFLRIRKTHNEVRQLEWTVDMMVNHCHNLLWQVRAFEKQERFAATDCEELESNARAIRKFLNQMEETLPPDQQSILARLLQENELLVEELRQIIRRTGGTRQ